MAYLSIVMNDSDVTSGYLLCIMYLHLVGCCSIWCLSKSQVLRSIAFKWYKVRISHVTLIWLSGCQTFSGMYNYESSHRTLIIFECLYSNYPESLKQLFVPSVSSYSLWSSDQFLFNVPLYLKKLKKNLLCFRLLLIGRSHI